MRAQRDFLLERRLRQELPAERREAAIADALSVIEVALGKPGESIDAALNRYFDAFSTLAQSPASSVARQEVLLQGESVAAAFRDMAGRIALSQRETDGQVHSLATNVSDLAAQIAKINQSIQRIADPGSKLHLQDQQGELVRQLSGIIDVDVLQRADGGLDVTIGNGRALVIGENDYPVTTSQATGTHRVFSGGVDITAEISGGTLGAPFNNVISYNTGNEVVNLSPNELTLRVTKATGTFSGTVREPGSDTVRNFGGVLLQKQNAGYGTLFGEARGSRTVLAAP